ncbi:uncharacterized protein [Primulina eburnea]|uniref:uncharacterized protein isoform X2 n=1 Tax=Primulina eburnea TaxID=1245227 RepID=UPI003C6C0674
MDSDRCFIGYRRMEVEELSLPKMRQMCDVYVRTLYPGSFGGSNTYLADEFLHVFRHIPQIALDAFNSAKGRNFKFVKFIKLNRISILFNSMTFEAKEDGSDECLLFRAVVNMIGTDNDGDESKDLGDDILSFVRPSGHYICEPRRRPQRFPDYNPISITTQHPTQSWRHALFQNHREPKQHLSTHTNSLMFHWRKNREEGDRIEKLKH